MDSRTHASPLSLSHGRLEIESTLVGLILLERCSRYDCGSVYVQPRLCWSKVVHNSAKDCGSESEPYFKDWCRGRVAVVGWCDFGEGPFWSGRSNLRSEHDGPEKSSHDVGWRRLDSCSRLVVLDTDLCMEVDTRHLWYGSLFSVYR
jgi:hypothetical protein